MTNFFLALAVIAGSCSAFGNENSDDPYERVQTYVLENGVRVWLGSSQKAQKINVRFRYNVGAAMEEHTGAAHLLEHALFRFSDKDDDYLNLMHENSIDINGQTTATETEYFASASHHKGLWLIEKMSEMLLDRKLNADMIEKAKKVVRLELLEKYNDKSELSVKNFHSKFDLFKLPGYWKLEYDYTPEVDWEDQLEGNDSLKLEEIKSFYDLHYQPQNLVIFITGNFDKEKVKNILLQSFGTQENLLLAPTRSEAIPRPKKRAYRVNKFHNKSIGYAKIGIQTWDLELRDQLVLDIYFEDLAQRLQRQFRTTEANTYTVYKSSMIWLGNGYYYVRFETPRHLLDDKHELVRQTLDREIFSGQLEDEIIQKALKREMETYKSIGHSAEDLFTLANYQEYLRREHQEPASRFEMSRELDPIAFKERLKRIASNKAADYEMLSYPYVFFKEEAFVVMLLVLALIFSNQQRLLARQFDRTKIRYMRAVDYSTLTHCSNVVLGIIFVSMLTNLTNYYIYMALHGLGLFRFATVSSVIYPSFIAGITFAYFLTYLSSLPGKIIITEDKVYLKSITPFSRVFKKDQLVNVQALRPHQVISKVSLKTRLFHKAFWRKGILLSFANGRQYYFGAEDPELACKEIQSFIPAHQQHPTKVAPEQAA